MFVGKFFHQDMKATVPFGKICVPPSFAWENVGFAKSFVGRFAWSSGSRCSTSIQPRRNLKLGRTWRTDEALTNLPRFPFFTLVANTLGCLCNALAGVYEATCWMQKIARFSVHHAGCLFLMQSHFFQERMTDALAISALGALSTGFAGSLSTAPGLKYVMKNCYHIRGWKLGINLSLANPCAPLKVEVDLDGYVWHGKRQSYLHFKDNLWHWLIA